MPVANGGWFTFIRCCACWLLFGVAGISLFASSSMYSLQDLQGTGGIVSQYPIEAADPVRAYPRPEDAGGVTSTSPVIANVGASGNEASEAVPHADAKGKGWAVFASMTNAPEDHYKAEDMAMSALFMKCTAECFGCQLPFHVVYGGGNKSNDEDLEVLRRFGWHIEDHRKDVKLMKDIYKPIYTDKEAVAKHRWWGHWDFQKYEFVKGKEVQQRHDGWATYFKFFAWKAVQYARLLIVDVDILFMANPEPVLMNLPPSVTFMASKQLPHGFNSHMMVVQPSNAMFDELVTRARDGEYLPYTQGDQDVLEAVYISRFVTKTRMETLIPHVHGNKCVPNGRPGWPPKDCKDVLKMCTLRFTQTPVMKKALPLLQKCM